MKRLFLPLILLLATIVGAHAAKKQYTLSVLGEYGYNSTWEHFGGGELRAYMPVNQYVDLWAAAEGLSSNVYTVSGTVRPKFPLPVGEIFIDASILYSAQQRTRNHDFVGALSLGYRMDYLDMQFGCFTRTMVGYGRTWNSEEELMTEPFNLMYRLSVNVQPLCNRWNIYFGMSNFTEVEYERMWQPLFFLGGYYDFRPSSNFEYEYNAASHFRLIWELICKPTGMFHLDASFYGARAKMGFAYKF